MPSVKKEAGTILTVRVTAGARTNQVKKATQPDGTPLLKVYVTAVAEKGKANAAVIRLLADTLNIPPGHLTIISGHTGKTKKIKIGS